MSTEIQSCRRRPLQQQSPQLQQSNECVTTMSSHLIHLNPLSPPPFLPSSFLSSVSLPPLRPPSRHFPPLSSSPRRFVLSASLSYCAQLR